MNKKKIEKITDLFGRLYCFEKSEVNEYMKRIPYMKKEGLDELIKSLEKGLKDQDAMLEKWTKRDPEYANKLAAFATKKTKELTDEYEAKEKDSADEILKELD